MGLSSSPSARFANTGAQDADHPETLQTQSRNKLTIEYKLTDRVRALLRQIGKKLSPRLPLELCIHVIPSPQLQQGTFLGQSY